MTGSVRWRFENVHAERVLRLLPTQRHWLRNAEGQFAEGHKCTSGNLPHNLANLMLKTCQVPNTPCIGPAVAL